MNPSRSTPDYDGDERKLVAKRLRSIKPVLFSGLEPDIIRRAAELLEATVAHSESGPRLHPGSVLTAIGAERHIAPSAVPDSELRLLRQACDAAFAFIDAHAADPDITDEMCIKHATYIEARQALENAPPPDKASASASGDSAAALESVRETRRILNGREDESFHISSAAALHIVYECLDKAEAALASASKG